MIDVQIIPWLVVLFPFIGFALNIFFGRFFSRFIVSVVGCLSIFLSFLASAKLFFYILATKTAFSSVSIPWIDVPGFIPVKVDFSLWIDQLSCVMMLVVSGVGFIIHFYSTGYMAGDKRYSRYFAFLNLFAGFMLLLVLAKNILLMFIGWEGVGLCSYLLIGFWFDDAKKGLENSRCGMKAFIVNRIGDLGFTIGMIILFTYIGTRFGMWTFDIPAIRSLIETNGANIDMAILTVCCILFFVGATGKSAQIPLYVWLPDAMAGPTPVSALIHAATMVTAGVYMISRFNFIYIMSPAAMTIVAIIGAFTALFSATIGICQNDIKRILAYSTISQIGYMFLGVGVGAFAAGIFHLMTHAFFKACLFLGAGSVIHGTGEQDIRNMGGLKRFMPVTFITFLIATLAIAGIPPFAGFFSKDEILFKTFTTDHLAIKGLGKFLWLIGAIGAFFTAFYMFRLFYKTFYGKFKPAHSKSHTNHRPHESPWNMTYPLIALAILSVIGGFIGAPILFHEFGISKGLLNKFDQFLSPVFESSVNATKVHHPVLLEFSLMSISVIIAILGIIFAYILYRAFPHLPEKIAVSVKGLYRTVANKYYVDEVYNAIIVEPLINFNVRLGKFDYDYIDEAVNFSGETTASASHTTGFFDNEVVDAAVNDVGRGALDAGKNLRRIQSGNIRLYLATAFFGALILIASYCIYLLF